jgi:hypothetical protein
MTLITVVAIVSLAAEQVGDASPGDSRVATAARSAGDAGSWRRTVDGWERMTAWRGQPFVVQPATAPLPHPFVVACLESLLSLLALLAFSGNRGLSGRGVPGRAPKTAAAG